MNSKCGVQSKRRRGSHESCVCIVGFPACVCQKKSELFKHTNPMDTKTIEDQRERSRPVNGNRVELVLKDFELIINRCSRCHTGPQRVDTKCTVTRSGSCPTTVLVNRTGLLWGPPATSPARHAILVGLARSCVSVSSVN